MRITGTTQVFFIIGDPVAQVKAPEVFNTLFSDHGIDAVLVPLKLAAADLPGFLQHGMKAQNVKGLWATIPHKAQLFDLLRPGDPVAQVAGAVNAVKRLDDGGLDAALFDGIGFVKGLDHLGIDVRGKRVLIVGAGGGGHAVAAAVAQRQPAVLAIHNRTPERAKSLAARLVPLMQGEVLAVQNSDAAGYDVAINCTSQGLKAGDTLPFDPTRMARGAAIVDIIMSKEPTPLLQAARAHGLQAEPGFEMLIQQVPEYLRFFGFANLAQSLQADLSAVRSKIMPH
jgi:shikimate dehydrogenase